MSVGDWNFPDADMSQDGGGKLAERERHDELDETLPAVVTLGHPDAQE